MKHKILIILCFVLASSPLFSRPQYSILQSYGMKCNYCHFNNQGGGLRTNMGYLSRKDFGLVKPADIGLGSVYDKVNSTNSFFGDMLLTSLDLRYQNAKWGPPEKPVRDNMLMQFSPSIAIRPTEWVEFEAFYNLAYPLELNKRYPGQQDYSASIYIRPATWLPSLRVGKFQPTIGQKWDDHTLLVRRSADPAKSSPIIPDDYSELGAQLDYEAIDYLSLSAGVFDTKIMSNINVFNAKNYLGEKIPLVKQNSLSYVFRAGYFPTIPGINAYLVGTLLYNGGLKDMKLSNDYFMTSSLSLNCGLTEKFALMTEYMHTEKQYARFTDNFLVQLDYQPIEPIIVYARAEKAITNQHRNAKLIDTWADNNSWDEYRTNQFVFGSHIILFPGLDLLPEYRIYDRESVPGYMSQWTFQLHFYF